MKTIYIRGGKGSNTAINVMRKHFEGLGHTVVRGKEDPSEVVVSWGCSYHGPKPCVNGNVNAFNKDNCFERFREKGVPCPQTFSIKEGLHRGIVRGQVFLARESKHSKGKDIVVCKTNDDLMAVARQGVKTFFSVFIPTETEYRVWVFKGKAFAIYEKVFKGGGEFQGYNRNRRMGFDFSKRDEMRGTHQIEGPSIKAVEALGMEWGAVDILKGKDGKYYVLEVNSMPNINNTKRSSGVRLAAAISKWAEEQ